MDCQVVVLSPRYGQTSTYNELKGKRPTWSHWRPLSETKFEWLKRYGGAKCKP